MGFDTYLRYDDLTHALHALAAEHPGLLRIESIGRSFEGRDIWLATVTNFATGADTGEAGALGGRQHPRDRGRRLDGAACYLLHHLVKRYGSDAEVTRCLDTRAFYVCPRLNPDGAELALADCRGLSAPAPGLTPTTRSQSAGLRREDIDGDGRVLTMRLPDPNGPWKVSERDPRLMVRREPEETGGQLLPPPARGSRSRARTA